MTILSAFLLSSSSAQAESPRELFKQANAAYAAGKFTEAAPLYQSALDQGLRNWVVYYDLGNAYYKTSQLGKAVASFARAFRMNSGDSDVVYNLTLASTKAGDPIVPTGALPALGWRLFYVLSLNTLAVWTSALFLALCGLLGWRLWGRRLSLDAVVVVGFAFAIAGLWLGLRSYFLRRPEGIVTVPTAEIRSGPTTSYPTNFTVPEGHRVLLLNEEEAVPDWLEIGVPEQGLKGWVPRSQIDVL